MVNRSVLRGFIIALALMLVVSVTLPAAGRREQTGVADDKLEIMSWWTTGGEVLGLEAMFEIYNERYPGIEIINAAVAGSRGLSARAVLATRMQGGNPPDSFQVLGGGALSGTWAGTDQLEPISWLYEKNNWFDVFPEQVIEQVSFDGEIYAVPVNIHRTNIMWYNKPLFNEHDLDPPTSLDEFFKIAEYLSAKGITPLALGSLNGWEPIHLLESVIVAVIGPNGYRGLFDGTTSWNSAGMIEVFEKYVRMLGYINRDHSGITGAGMAQYVVDGRTAMTIMGDWIAGYYAARDYEPDVDFGWAVAPGTKGSYLMNSDTFVLPRGPINRDRAIAWLEVVGSREGQDAFNPKKGSIPARIDADVSLYRDYHRRAMADFERDELLPSLAHGMAVSDAWLQDIREVMTVFIVDRNVESAIRQLSAIANEHL
jgi:glucose/mannose transport system substrate-binding protein